MNSQNNEGSLNLGCKKKKKRQKLNLRGEGKQKTAKD